MKIEFLAGNWKTVLKSLSPIATNNRTNEAWKMLLIDCKTQMVTASNDNIVIMSKLPLKSESQDSFLIDASRFASVVTNQPNDAKITLDVSKENVLFKVGRSKFKLGTLPVEQYARTDKPTDMSSYFVDSSTFKRAIDNTLPFIGDANDARIMLRGVNFESDGQAIKMTSSNGDYLSHVRFAGAEIKQHENGVGQTAILPPEFLRQAQRLASESSKLMMYLSDKKVGISTQTQIVWSKVIDAKYLNYAPLLNVTSNNTFTPDINAWQTSIARIKPLSDQKKGNPVVLSNENGVMKMSVSNEIGDSEEYVDAIQVGFKDEVRLNMDYLDTVLKGHDAVKVVMPEQNSPHIHFIEEADGFSCHQAMATMTIN